MDQLQKEQPQEDQSQEDQSQEDQSQEDQGDQQQETSYRIFRSGGNQCSGGEAVRCGGLLTLRPGLSYRGWASHRGVMGVLDIQPWPGRAMVLMCLSVRLSVCLSVPPPIIHIYP